MIDRSLFGDDPPHQEQLPLDRAGELAGERVRAEKALRVALAALDQARRATEIAFYIAKPGSPDAGELWTAKDLIARADYQTRLAADRVAAAPVRIPAPDATCALPDTTVPHSIHEPRA